MQFKTLADTGFHITQRNLHHTTPSTTHEQASNWQLEFIVSSLLLKRKQFLKVFQKNCCDAREQIFARVHLMLHWYKAQAYGNITAIIHVSYTQPEYKYSKTNLLFPYKKKKILLLPFNTPVAFFSLRVVYKQCLINSHSSHTRYESIFPSFPRLQLRHSALSRPFAGEN